MINYLIRSPYVTSLLSLLILSLSVYLQSLPTCIPCNKSIHKNYTFWEAQILLLIILWPVQHDMSTTPQPLEIQTSNRVEIDLPLQISSMPATQNIPLLILFIESLCLLFTPLQILWTAYHGSATH